MGLRRYQPRHAAVEPGTGTALDAPADEHDEVLLDPPDVDDSHRAGEYARPQSA